MPEAVPPVSLVDQAWIWSVPLGLVVLGLVAGLVVERVVLTRLRRWSERSGWRIDHILIDGIKGVAFFWCLMLGIYLALREYDLGVERQALASKVLVVALMFSLTVAIARVAGGLVTHAAVRSGGAVPSSIITNLMRVVVYIIGFLVILDSVGVQITPVLTALGVGGLAVALALQDTLGNLFAGLQLVASKKFSIGDYVRLDSGEEGIIIDLAWRYTTIRTLASNLIIIPNSKLGSAIVTNFNLPTPDIPVPVPVGVAYGSDLDRVERVSIEVASEIQRTMAGAVREFVPVVSFNALADSSVNFNVIMRAATFDAQFALRHELIKRLHARFRAEGIEIPFPTRTVQLTSPVPAPT
jgi:small-conductance mechanosensitive channel